MDLKKLQTLLDEALAAETKESLNAWIDEQIKKDLIDENKHKNCKLK